MIIAVDIGSTKTIVACLDESGKILERTKFATPRQSREWLELIQATIASAFSNYKFDKIIVGVPGIVKDNRIHWCSNLGSDWIGLDIANPLSKTFKANVLLENDANLAGIAETTTLPKEYDNIIYLNIGAGIGSGFIIKGKLIPGLLNTEAGLTMIEYDGVTREWEKFASGRAIVEAYDRKASEITSPGMWQAVADRISRGLLVLIPIIQPNLIIVGGSMGEYFNHYANYLSRLIDEKLPDNLDRPKIIPSVYKEDAVLIGCYRLANENIYLKI